MVPKRLKGIINAHIQRSIMYAGYCNDFLSSNIHIFSEANDFIFVSFLIAWRHRRKGNKPDKHRGAWGVDKDKCTAYGDQIFNYTQGYDDNPMQLKALYSKRMPSQTPTTPPPPSLGEEKHTKRLNRVPISSGQIIITINYLFHLCFEISLSDKLHIFQLGMNVWYLKNCHKKHELCSFTYE